MLHVLYSESLQSSLYCGFQYFCARNPHSGVLSIIYQVGQIYSACKKHIKIFLFIEKSSMFTRYELGGYLDKCFVTWVTMSLSILRCTVDAAQDESIAELSVLLVWELQKCLFVLSSFSPVMIGWYLQAVSTCKMTQMAVFPYDILLLCSSVEYFTPASTLVL